MLVLKPKSGVGGWGGWGGKCMWVIDIIKQVMCYDVLIIFGNKVKECPYKHIGF